MADRSNSPQVSESTRACIQAILSVAGDWQDLDHPGRLEAEEKTLKANNRFTQEATVFAINQQLSLLTESALNEWAVRLNGAGGKTVGVLNPGNVPFAGLQDLLAVILSGNDYAGTVSSRSPALLPDFGAALLAAGLERSIVFDSFDRVLTQSDALIASGADETMHSVREKALTAGIESDRLLLRGHRYSIAVIDGMETPEEKIGLAEDMLLHEGLGCRNVALVWAPDETIPDPYLEAMATFRSTFPAHPDSGRALKMQLAYLEAVGMPHARGDNLEFLLSRGTPEVQAPPHIRWTEFQDFGEVEDWIRSHESEIQLLIASDRIELAKSSGLERVKPGFAQRPELGWKQDGEDIAEFLRRITLQS